MRSAKRSRPSSRTFAQRDRWSLDWSWGFTASDANPASVSAINRFRLPCLLARLIGEIEAHEGVTISKSRLTKVAAQKQLRWRRPRHTLKGHQD
jgi:hypothetical protein